MLGDAPYIGRMRPNDDGVIMQRSRLAARMLLGLCFVASTIAAAPSSAAPRTISTAFDGKYTGSMSLGPFGHSTQDRTSPACVETRPAEMTIRNGYVYIHYADWKRHRLHYRGTVNAYGRVDAYHTNRDGSSSILAGRIRNSVLTADMERGLCDYSLTLAKN